MKTIVIVNGFPESGKDTFVDLCRNYLHNTHKIKSFKFSSVDLVKEAAILLGWDGEKTDKGRNFLSELKMLSTKYWDGSVEYIKDRIVPSNDTSVYFIFIREPEEIQRIKEYYTKEHLYKVIVVLVSSSNSKKYLGNIGDSSVVNSPYDVEIINNFSKENPTMDNLKEIAEIFCMQYLKETK